MSWSGLRSVAFNAAWIFSGSVDPARLIASARTKNPCIPARAGVVEVAAVFGFEHLIDDVAVTAWLADVKSAAIDGALRHIAGIGNEGRIGKAGVVADDDRR